VNDQEKKELKKFGSQFVELMLIADEIFEEYRERRKGEAGFDPPTIGERVMMAQALAGLNLVSKLGDQQGKPGPYVTQASLEATEADRAAQPRRTPAPPPGTIVRGASAAPGAPAIAIGPGGQQSAIAPDPKWAKATVETFEFTIRKEEVRHHEWEKIKRVLRETDEGKAMLSLLSYENFALRKAGEPKKGKGAPPLAP